MEDSPNLKKEKSMVDASNYYLFKSEVDPNAKPKKLSDVSIEARKQLEETHPEGYSVWNESKTWEEKNYIAVFRKDLTSKLKGFKVTVEGKDFIVDQIESVQGDVTVMFVRGVRRFYSNISLKGKWQLASGDAKDKTTGDFEIKEYETGEQYEFKVTTKNREKKDNDAKRLFTRSKKELERQIEDCLENFRVMNRSNK